MDKRTLFYNFALSIGLYYVIPLLFIKYYLQIISNSAVIEV